MAKRILAPFYWLFGPEPISNKRPGHLWPRWIFLRALGLIYFSAFYSLLFQIKGLLGPNGILPARDYLQAVAAAPQLHKYLFAPTLLWLGSSDRALMLVCWTGAIASLLVFLNVWPRGMLVVCFVCFLSFVSAAQDFSGYQSDGMLLEAGFFALFFAPPGFLPGLGRAHPPSRASLWLLLWEWFCIYFESGVAKMRSGDPTWRNFTAMNDYYQNAPLPTWIAWYVDHFPHWFHASTVFYTLAVELVLAWMVLLPRRFRIVLFFIVAPFQISIILTGNYAFLNYIVFSLGFLLFDDRFIEWILPRRIGGLLEKSWFLGGRTFCSGKKAVLPSGVESIDAQPGASPPPRKSWLTLLRRVLASVGTVIAAVCLAFVFYASAAKLFLMFFPSLPLPEEPLTLLEPFRVADPYGLFANMTHSRYEIEFQGSLDGKSWISYPFRYKPQDVRKPPGIYAPYQPRFEWNLWFASLGSWTQYRWVIGTEERLLAAEPDVLELFAVNPFSGQPPQEVRTVIYQYWFTDMKTKRATGEWWQRELLGEYAPPLERAPGGQILIPDMPTVSPNPFDQP